MLEIVKRMKTLRRLVTREKSGDRDDAKGGLLARFKKIQGRLSTELGKQITEFFEKFSTFEGICEAMQIEDGKGKKYTYLPKEMKLNLVLEKKEMIEQMASELKKLDTLKGMNEFNFLKVYNSQLEGKYEGIQKDLGVLNKGVTKNEEEIQKTLVNFTHLVEILSKKMVYFDEILQKYEVIVDDRIRKKDEELHPTNENPLIDEKGKKE